MLRLIVLLLLVANGGFYAWSRGYLNQFGFASASKNESFRLAEQLEPDRIVITTSAAAPSTAPVTPSTAPVTPLTAPVTPLTAPVTVSTPAPTVVTTCLTAGAFNDRQSTLLKQMLNDKLPDMRWRFDTVNIPARWIVYMGKYPNENARELKKKQLDKIKVRYEALTESNLEPGLSLGSYESQATANLALQQLLKQGVRTARVLQESPEQKAQTLVAPAVDDAMREALNAAYATIAVQLANKSLQVCKN